MSAAVTIPTTRSIDSPIGHIALAATAEGLTHLQFGPVATVPQSGGAPSNAAGHHLDRVEKALRQYFDGRRTSFEDLTLAPAGTVFQRRVWKALRSIPYGRTTTYGAVARRIRRPGAARAVGMANNRNPISIIIPCHRVIGSDGRLTGYGGGLDAKAWLLRHEASHADGVAPPAAHAAR